jgi:hypothetical protein
MAELGQHSASHPSNQLSQQQLRLSAEFALFRVSTEGNPIVNKSLACPASCEAIPAPRRNLQLLIY